MNRRTDEQGTEDHQLFSFNIHLFLVHLFNIHLFLVPLFNIHLFLVPLFNILIRSGK